MTDNMHDIDPAALAAEADAIAAEVPAETAPGEAPAAPPADPAAQVEAWGSICDGAVQLLDVFVCPAWVLEAREKAALAEALAPVLNDLFPGGLGNERWAPYFRLAMVASGVAFSRFDRDAGKFKPLRLPPPKPTKEPVRDDRPAA